MTAPKTINNETTSPVREGIVLEKILAWSDEKRRALWQRNALRKILQENEIEDTDIEELVLCLKDEKLERPSTIATQPLSQADLPAIPDVLDSVKINKLSNILHVNNLAPNQELTFSDEGITVIYGDNGSGKSGYTRILKNACLARHRGEILTNILAPDSEGKTPVANIHYSTDAGVADLVNWEKSNKPHEILSAVYVFDRQCAKNHIRKQSNEIMFSPYGLDIPEKLADVCQRMEKNIERKVNELTATRNDIFSNPPWQATTVAGAFVKNMTKDSKIEDLERKSTFTKEDEDRLKFLTETLSKDPHKAASDEEAKAARLSRFKGDIITKIKMLSQEKLDAILKQKQIVTDTKNAAESAARGMMGEDALLGVGEEVWKIMWKAAREYSTTVAYTEIPFPNTEDGSKCVLCQQELDIEAKERMKSFEKHISGELEKKAEQEKVAYISLCEKSRSGSIRFLYYLDVIKDIKLIDTDLLEAVRRYLASIRLRQILFNCLKKKTLPELLQSPFTEIDAQIKKHQLFAAELRELANNNKIATLETEKMELEDKKAIKNHKQSIINEIKRLSEISLLNDCIKDTKTTIITTLGNKIADEVITPKIRDCFQNEITNLVGNRVQVKLERHRSSRGVPKYKLSFPSKPNIDLPTVLSEGEQTCVAMASFLAELATSSHKSALVFDDPISSLDHHWRFNVAKRLVKEAKIRQVIVFTHDLTFLNDIKGESKNEGVAFSSRYLSRKPKIVGIVNDNQPWDQMKILARIDDLGKKARKIRDTYDDLTTEEYNSKVRIFFSLLRASWEKALEEVGLSNVVVRYRDYIDTGKIHKISALDFDDCETLYREWSYCSSYTESHDSARNSVFPRPDELLAKVDKLTAWVKKIKEKKKQIKD